jgi:hypothetical protein
MRHGRPICWLVVVVAVVMSVMSWGTAQAGPIKWSGEGYAPWRLGDPGEPPGGKSRRVQDSGPLSLIPVRVGGILFSFVVERGQLRTVWVSRIS